MTGETSGPSAQDIRMASFEEKFNDLLNFVRLLVKRDTEIDPNVAPENDPSPKGNWNTLEGPQSLQMYGNGEENVMNKKEDDHSDIRSLQGQPLYPSNQGDTIEPHSDVDGHSSKGSKESEKEAQSPISKKEEPKEVDHPMIPHKRKAIRDLASHSPRGQASTKSLSKRETRRHRRQETLMLHTGAIPIQVEIFLPSAKLKSESRKFCTLPMPMDELYPRPGHSLEDCHALKNKVQDLVDHGILRINEGSTPSVIIAWPPEHCKDENCHPFSSRIKMTEYRASRCMTLKRKIQGLGHSEPDVPFMVQARKPSMHTVPMKKARSTLGFRRQWAIKRSDRANHFQGAPEPGSRIAKDEFSRPRHHHHRRGRSTH
uniref:Uncharacterized protein n=1 Tax=Fagus sylvatica TaxID=28930 RepID=A0A2N9FQW4_FAGSY